VRRVAALIAFVAVLASCGRKAAPLPPIIEVPETTTDLSLHQEEHEIVLWWSYPTLTRGGRTLTDLARIEVWRLQVPAGEQAIPPGPAGDQLRRQLMLARGKLIAKLAGESLKAATRGSRLEFRDPIPSPAEGSSTPPTLWYAVRTVRRDGTASALSNIVVHQVEKVPPPVTGFTAKPGADGIALSWDAIAGVRYVLERRNAAGGTWRDHEPLITEQTSVVDKTAQQGQTWQYRIRSLEGKTTGPISQVVEVNYLDVYPPPPPASLICLPQPDVVRLRWDPSPEGGVTYSVSRRQDEAEWHELGHAIQATEFADGKPPEGSAAYSVRAVDAAGNQSDAVTCTVRVGP
jgi:hypothetical protein